MKLLLFRGGKDNVSKSMDVFHFLQKYLDGRGECFTSLDKDFGIYMAKSRRGRKILAQDSSYAAKMVFQYIMRKNFVSPFCTQCWYHNEFD